MTYYDSNNSTFQLIEFLKAQMMKIDQRWDDNIKAGLSRRSNGPWTYGLKLGAVIWSMNCHC